MPRSRDSALRSEVNVTPLIDVVLVLLIIFMVVTPMLTPAADLPRGGAPTTIGAGTPHADLVVRADGTILLDDRVVAPEELEASLRAMRGKVPRPVIILYAGSAIPYGTLRPALIASGAAGFDVATLAVEPPR
jgi:biopolymer transport protein ExbD